MRIEHWFYKLPLRMRSLISRRRVEQELDDELQFHLQQKTERYVSQGLEPVEARLAALREMDGLTQRKEECRDARGLNLMDDAVKDIRYSLRILAKSPGFTLVAALTLALAIGANAVVFGILNGLILRPLNLPGAGTLVGIERGKSWGYVSYPDYLDLRDRNRTFEGLAAYNIDAAGLDTGAGNPSPAWLYEVSGNYFDVLGIQPYLGRFFHGADEHGPNSAPYIVLTYAFWQTQFQGDRSVIGRVVRLNKHPFTVVGVAPPGFRGSLLFFAPNCFVPLVNDPQINGQYSLNTRSVRWIFDTFGRLKPGVKPSQAVADLNSIGSWLAKTYPKDDGNTTFYLGNLALPGIDAPARAFVTGLMLLAGLILLAACANLGNLFAARAADRSREVALRLALGASRGRVLRGLFTEALLISGLGGAMGLAGSVVLLRALAMWRPIPRFPIQVPVEPDASVYIMALLLALVSGFLFGIVPVRQVMRTDAYQIVKAGSAGAAGRRITMRDLLLAAQIAICAVLVTSSIVALRGLTRSMNADFGLEPRDALLAQASLRMAGYEGSAAAGMRNRMRDAVAAIPGVRAVGMIDNPPLLEGWTSALVFSDRTTDLRPSNAAATVVLYAASPEYFEAAGTALLAGRTLSRHDDAHSPRVAVVNREFARKLFGSPEKAVGNFFKRRDGTRIQVVGVTVDGKYTTYVAEDRQAAIFLSLDQTSSGEVSLVVRSGRDARQLAAAVRGKLRDLDAAMPVYIETWTEGMNGALFSSRVATVSLGVLGAMGAMLAITGIFGMAAYSVSRRLKELGIRLALGARRTEVLGAALGRALRLLAFGSAAGLALGLLASQVLAQIVYQATPRDPLVLTGVVMVMALLGLLATWIPAQRALSLDPLTLLREE